MHDAARFLVAPARRLKIAEGHSMAKAKLTKTLVDSAEPQTKA
jgi:hypothetical protein